MNVQTVTKHYSPAQAVLALGADSALDTPGERGDVAADQQDKIYWAQRMERIRDHRDRAAFAEVFREFAPRVKGFLLNSGATNAGAEEAMQEAMIAVWNKAHLFDATRASASTWIFTISRNKRIDALRRKRPEPEELAWGPEPEPDAADVVALQEETEKLTQAIAKLPKNQRDLVKRAYFGELSHTEISAETGLPLGTIKSRIRLALEKLRHDLKREIR